MPGLVRRPVVVWLLAALAVPVLLTAARVAVAEVDSDPAVPVERTVAGTAESTTTPPPAATPTVAEPAVAPFEVSMTADSITVRAVVRDEQVREAITEHVGKLLAEDGVFDSRITVDVATGLSDATALSALLRALATANGDAAAKYDGTTVTLTGRVADQATKATAARAAAKAAPGAVVANQLQIPEPPKPAISEACRTFESRLAEFSRQHPINFLSGTAIVNDASKPSVVKAAVLLKTCATATVEVAGHTDNLGDPATSLPLSQRRAEAVKATLVRLGVPAGRIVARGYGETSPVASNTTAAGRIANRRVELRVP